MFFGLFRKTPDQVVEDAEATTAVMAQRPTIDPHDAATLARAGMDLETIIRLIEMFGPLIVAVVNRWLARHRAGLPEPQGNSTPE